MYTPVILYNCFSPACLIIFSPISSSDPSLVAHNDGSQANWALREEEKGEGQKREEVRQKRKERKEEMNSCICAVFIVYISEIY